MSLQTLKKPKTFFSFFILILFAIPLIFSFIGISKETKIENVSCLLPNNTVQRDIIKTSDNTLHAVYVNNSDGAGNLIHAYSTDDGTTWTRIIIFVGLPTCVNLVVDGNNILHVIYVNGTLSLMYCNYQSGIWGNWKTIDTANNLLSYASICIDNLNNIYISYFKIDVGPVYAVNYIKYNSQLHTWSSLIAIDNNPASHLSMDCDNNNNVYLVYRSATSLIGWKKTYASNTFSYLGVVKNDMSGIMSILLSCYNNNIYIIYSATMPTCGINFTYSLDNGYSWINENIYYDVAHHNLNPTLSIDENGYIFVLWDGASADSSDKQIMGKMYKNNIWSDIFYCSYGINDKCFPHLLYQNYPNFMKLNNEFKGIFGNLTGNYFVYYFDSENIINLINFQPVNDSGDKEIIEGDYTIFGCGCNNQYYFSGNRQFIEQHFNIPLSGQIYAYEIFLYSSYATNYDKNYYELYVNGILQGNPDYITLIGSCYRMRWVDINIDLNNEELVFELKSNELRGLNYWSVSTTTTDCFGDGLGPFLIHNNGVFHGDGLKMMGPYEYNVYTKDICANFYFSLNEPEPNPPIPNITPFDDIELNGDGYLGIHSIYGIENYYQNTSVLITYNLATLTQTSYMYIYYEGIETGQTQFFSPKRLDDYGGILAFVPFNIGNYTVVIERNSIEVANRSFYSTENDYLYQIYTIPAKTNIYDSYKVFYKYLNGEKTGVLCVWNINTQLAISEYDLNNIDDADIRFYIEKNETNIILYNPSYFDRNIDYWRLFVQISADYYEPVGSIHKHYVSQIGLTNSISVSCGEGGIYTVGANDLQYTTANFQFSHIYIGGEVGIFINNQKVKDIGSISTGYFTYQINKAGFYKAYMKVFINNTWYGIANCTFYVVFEYGEKQEDIFDLSKLPILIKVLVTLVLTIVLTITPLMMSFLISRGNIEIHIPSLVYVIFFFLGLIVSAMLGIFDIAYMFIILFGLILVIVLLWLRGRTNEAGE